MKCYEPGQFINRVPFLQNISKLSFSRVADATGKFLYSLFLVILRLRPSIDPFIANF